MFYSYGDGNAYELSDGKTINLSTKNIEKNRPIKFISYSNKLKPEIQKIYQDIGVTENVKMKSSLKFCVVAAGEYDGYVAEPRAYEWDIAAGHAILDHRQVVLLLILMVTKYCMEKKILKIQALFLKVKIFYNG